MDAATIIYIALAIGGIVGGILTAINKVRFMTKKEFEKEQSACRENVCRKIDDVAGIVGDLKIKIDHNTKEAQERREKDQKNLNDHLINIATFVGKVEQYMVNKKL